MRRFLYLILGTLIFVSCAKEWEAPEWTITDGERTFERKDTPLTREQAWQVVKHYFYGDDEGNIVGDVVESLDILEPNVIIDSIAVQLAIENGWTDVEFRRSPDYRSWFFHVRETPGGSIQYGRLIFVSEYGDKIETRKNGFEGWITVPVSTVHTDPIHFSQVPSTRNVSDFFQYDPTKTNVYSNNPHRYAIIINSVGSKDSNDPAFWNDCSLVYQLLTKVYKYPSSNITIFNTDGNDPANDMKDGNTYVSSSLDYDFDGSNETVYPATSYSIQNKLSSLASTITSNDDLYVHISGHGGYYNSSYYLPTWGDDLIGVSTLKTLLSNISAKHVVLVIDNCYSGSVLQSFHNMSNYDIITSTPADDVGYYSPQHYSWFTKYWVDALKDYNSDVNGDMQLSIQEAFDYAKPKTIQMHSNQVPQQYYYTYNLSSSLGLENIWLNASLIGYKYFNGSTDYLFANQPSGTQVNWTINKTYWINNTNQTTTTNQTGHIITINCNPNYSYDVNISATADDGSKRLTYNAGATTGTYGPHLGALYWNSNSKSGRSSYNSYQNYAEFQIDQTSYFYTNYFMNNYNYRVDNPIISACDGLDLSPQTYYTNYATVCPTESGEGYMQVYLTNNVGEGEPFLVPFIVFDPLSFNISIHSDSIGSFMTISSSSQNRKLQNIKSVEIQDEDRNIIVKNNNIKHNSDSLKEIRIELKALKNNKGTYIVKITDDRVHYLKVTI